MSNPSSSAAAAPPPLDDEDLLSEILLRLPPLPSSLPRASLACKLWRRIVSDARFLRRFREHHHRHPPLLGCFLQGISPVHLEPTLEPPNRVPQARFSFPIAARDAFMFLGCRHGLVLISHMSPNQLLIWDPITGDQHRLEIPPGFDTEETLINGAVLRASGEAHDFQVVLVGNSDRQLTQVVASVYSSKTGVWSNLVSTLLPDDDPDVLTRVYHEVCSVMIGNSLYWLLIGNLFGILEFNLDTQSLSVIHVPLDIVDVDHCSFVVMRAEGGGLGFLFLSGYFVQLWKRKTDGDGVASWVLGRTVALDKLLSINSEGGQSPRILGFAEDNNAVLVWTFIGVFMVQFESLQLKKLFESYRWLRYYPFEGVYTADARIGGGLGEAKLLCDT